MTRGARRNARTGAWLAALGTAVLAAGAAAPSSAGASPASQPAVTLVASAPSATVGSPLTLTATVTGSTPTGTVEFLAGGTPLACGGSGGVTLASGSTQTATCSVASLPGPAGDQSLTAVYLGDASNLPAAAAIEEPVSAKATTTALSAPDAAAGVSVSYTATVTAAGGPVASGTVLFSDDGAPIAGCGAVAVSSGSASCTRSSGPGIGAHDVEAAFSGTPALSPSTAAAAEAIGGSAGATATTVTLVTSASHPEAGTAITLGAVVAAPSVGSPPAGSVTFTDGGAALAGCMDVALQVARGTPESGATCSLPSGLSPSGPHELQALYLPSSSTLAAGTSASTAVEVEPGTAAVTVTASPDPAPGGSPITVTASVVSDGDQAPADGSLQVDVAGAPASCASEPDGLLTLSSGEATCTLNGLSPGDTLISATYLGDGNLRASTAIAPLTVDPPLDATNVTVTASANPAATGQAVTYDATVTGGTTTPTGDVTFSSNGIPINGCIGLSLSANGSAPCAVGAGYASAGVVVISVSYGGDSTHLQGAGAWSETVGTPSLVIPQISLAADADPAASGQPVTFTAVVSSDAGAPDGTVSFGDNGSTIPTCGSVMLQSISSSSAKASCTLAGGFASDLSQTVTASYAGDAAKFGPASTATTDAVWPASVSSRAANVPTSVVGQDGVLEVALTGAFGLPTGSVQFSRAGNAIACASDRLSAGSASCDLSNPPLSSGYFSFQVVYSGDSSYAPAVVALGDETTATGDSSAKVQLTATPASPAPTGTDVQLAVAVTGKTGTPTGDVTLTDDGVPMASCGKNGMLTLSSGSATCDAGSALTAGVHDIVASYGGDTAYGPASSLLAAAVTTPTAPPVGSGSSGSGSGSGSSGSSGSGSSGSGSTGTGGGTGSAAGSGSGTGGVTPGGTGGLGGSGGRGGQPVPGSPSAGGSGPGGPRPTPPSGGATTGGSPGSSSGSSGGGSASPEAAASGKAIGRRSPALSLRVPLQERPGQRLVYRLHVAGLRGPVGGSVTFRIDGHPVRGCTNVRLGRASSMQVTCTLHDGIATPGYRVVTATYSGGRRYAKAKAAALEDVEPRWRGLWIVSATGRLTAEGGAPALPRPDIDGPVVAAAMPPAASGLVVLTRAGGVHALGAAHAYGSGSRSRAPFTALAPTRDGRGYWLLSASGALSARGDAPRLAGATASARTGRFVALAATPDGLGCWLLSSRGALVARGDARTYPPRTNRRPPAGPYVGLVASPDGRGYTLLTASGGLVAYGDATPVRPGPPAGPPRRFVGILRGGDHGGLWLVTRAGSIVPVGRAPEPARHGRLPGPAVAAAGT